MHVMSIFTHAVSHEAIQTPESSAQPEEPETRVQLACSFVLHERFEPGWCYRNKTLVPARENAGFACGPHHAA